MEYVFIGLAVLGGIFAFYILFAVLVALAVLITWR